MCAAASCSPLSLSLDWRYAASMQEALGLDTDEAEAVPGTASATYHDKRELLILPCPSCFVADPGLVLQWSASRCRSMSSAKCKI